MQARPQLMPTFRGDLSVRAGERVIGPESRSRTSRKAATAPVDCWIPCVGAEVDRSYPL